MKECILQAVGDIALFKSIRTKVMKYDVDFLFKDVKEVLSRADVIFGNFEFPFSTDGVPFFPYSYDGYRADFSLLPHFSTIGFDVLNLANNHIMDWGSEGVEMTKKALGGCGIKTVGAGANSAEARRSFKIQRNGVRLGFLGYTKSGDWIATRTKPGAAKLEIEAIQEDVSNLKESVDHVIISLHWGVEFSDYPSPGDIKIAHKIIDMGVSVILGHHPHVIQGYEMYCNGLIFYSLGNFVYDPYSERVFVDTKLNERLENIIAEIRFTQSNIVSFSVVPVKINTDLRPVVLNGEEKERLIGRLNSLSANVENSKSSFFHSALANLWVRELKTYKLRLKENGWHFVWSRLRALEVRHIKLLVGFIISKIMGKSGHGSGGCS